MMNRCPVSVLCVFLAIRAINFEFLVNARHSSPGACFLVEETDHKQSTYVKSRILTMVLNVYWRELNLGRGEAFWDLW